MKTRFCYLACILLIQFAAKAQMKIGNNPTTINNASLLELETTDKGLVFPRVSLTNVTSSSPLAATLLTGTVVFNTNSSVTGGNGVGLYYWGGSVWTNVTTSVISNYWTLTGNSGTNSAINFLGTTDNHPLKFQVNNTIGGYIDSSGGSGNTLLGYAAGYSNTTGTKNTVTGTQSLYTNTTGFNNSAFGYQVLFSNTTGRGNTAAGYTSMYSNTTGQYNTAFGLSSLKNNTTGNYNVAVGQSALQNNTTGNNNAVVGEDGMLNNISGNYLAGLGTNALFGNTTGSSNTAVGESTLYSNTTGAYNTALGAYSLFSNTTSNNNISIGYYAGNLTTTGGNNIFIGSQSGASNLTGTNNTLIGTNTGVLTTALTNAAALGYNAKVGSNNSLVLGDTITGGSAVNVGIGVRYPLKRLHIDAASIAGAKDSLKIDNLASSSSAYRKALLVMDSTTGYISKQNMNTLAAGYSWSLTGNSGTNYSSNFLGTTDNASLRFRTNNIERMIIDSLGSAGIGSSAFNAANKEKLLVDYGSTTSHTLAYFGGSVDDYFQINLQNKNSGTSASTDYVATSDDGTDSTYYVDMGINSSTYAPGVENFGGPHDAYLYAASRNLLIGAASSNADIIFLLGGGKIRNNAAFRLNGADGNIIVGGGESTTVPIGNTVRGPNGNGTNIAGGSLTLQGGLATGTATGGSLNLYGGGTASGSIGAVNINTNINSATNINTGTSAGTVTIGNSLNNINLPKLSASSLVLTDASKNLTSSTPSASTYLYYNGTNYVWNNATQTTATLNTFTSALKGLAPASGGGTTNFLRADGTWAAPLNSGGTVTSVSFVDDNGFTGTITNPTTTPQLTLSTDVTGILEGDGTSMLAATPGIDYTDGTSTLGTGILKSTTGTGTISIAIASDFPILNQNTTGRAATVTTNANLTGPVTSVGNATSVTANAITNTMLAQIPTQTFRGRITAGTGNVEDLTIAQTKTLLGLTGSNTGDQTITLTSDVTGSGTGSFATTIAANAVTNAKLAQIATQTFKGRISGGTGNVEDLTIAQTKSLLNLTGTNSGDQTITLTGDVTGSGTASFASTIAPGAVTYSKIQNVSATDKVLGRTSAGAGSIEEISTTGSGNVVRANSPALVTPTGIVKGDVGLGNVDNTSDINKPVSTATQTALDLKIDLTQKAANNGVATLDAGGKVPASQLPVGSQVYKGTWNAATNTPTLADGVGTAGWTYRVTTAGTSNLGSGAITFGTGDDVIYNGTIWQRNPSAVDVTSVNTQTGAVVLTTDNIAEGTTNKYYTDARARTSLSATAPLAYNSATGAFSIPVATTSANGYLSSADWNTFNGKQAAGNYVTALTGDVTATGPGSVAATIANNAVTYAKMQVMTANKLLGSGASGTSVAEITLGTGLSFTGTTLNASLSGGTVTNVSVASANGFAGTVANATTTPAITVSTSITGILKGNGTAISAAIASDFPTLNQNTTGNAATVTTNANLTGPVTSVGNATSVTANAITNAMLAQISTQTFKGRISAGTGNVEDLTATQVTSMLNTFTSATQGLVPASGGGTTNFLRADGTFASPVGTNYRNLVTLGADVINSSAVANTLADVTGLSFPVTAGVTYRFYALIPYTSAVATTGSRWTINAPATTLLTYTSRYTLTATAQTLNFASAIGIPAASNASSLVAGSTAVIEGIIKPSANGTVQIRFASEIANSAVTAKAGATLEWW